MFLRVFKRAISGEELTDPRLRLRPGKWFHLSSLTSTRAQQRSITYFKKEKRVISEAPLWLQTAAELFLPEGT